MMHLSTNERTLLFWLKEWHSFEPFAFDFEIFDIPPWFGFDRADLRHVFNSLGRRKPLRIVVQPDGRYRVVPTAREEHALRQREFWKGRCCEGRHYRDQCGACREAWWENERAIDRARRQRVRAQRAVVHALTCEVCGEGFEAKRSDARFCGATCRQRHRRAVTDKDTSPPPTSF
jgi:hypothetical protein